MDIRVGSVPEIGRPADSSLKPQGAVEARILAIRSPRRRSRERSNAAPERRERSGHPRDPINGRVLVLMIPDGSVLPQDLTSGDYRVFLRFARR